MTEPPVIDVSVPCPGWSEAVAEVGEVARRAALAALEAAAEEAGTRLPSPAEVSLVLADDALARTLNRDYRGRDRPTNVLAFAGEVESGPAAGAPALLGDVVVAFETASGEAAAEGRGLADHLSHLVVHGILHLLGHDHQTVAGAARMERLEVRALSRLGIADPYTERTAG